MNPVECIDTMREWALTVSGECEQLKRRNTIEGNKLYLLRLEQFRQITEREMSALLTIIDASIDKTKKNLRT